MIGSQPRSGLTVCTYCAGEGRGVSLADDKLLTTVVFPTLLLGGDILNGYRVGRVRSAGSFPEQRLEIEPTDRTMKA